MKPWTDIADVDFSSPESIERYAKQLEGMTFREILDLEICPDGVKREYGVKRYKGGMGALIEEPSQPSGPTSGSPPEPSASSSRGVATRTGSAKAAASTGTSSRSSMTSRPARS